MGKNTTIFISGIGWLLISIMLLNRALSWIDEMPAKKLAVGISSGIIIGILKFNYIFKKLSIRNINKIKNHKSEKINILKLFPLKSYIMVLIMIIGGITIRHLEIIPEYILFSIYFGIGLAMIFTGIFYFYNFKKSYKKLL